VLRVSRYLSLFAPVLLACGGDETTGPTMASVAGNYTATTFTATDANGTIDLLAGGASITATLNADGTTTGRPRTPSCRTSRSTCRGTGWRESGRSPGPRSTSC